MYGQGAGMMATASAVVGDCIDIIEGRDNLISYGSRKAEILKIKDIKNVKSKYYLRMMVMDKPGVVHAISGILSDLNISIESVNQKKIAEKQEVPIFMVTHEALEKNLLKAVARIEKLDFVKGKPVFIRVL